MAMRLVSFVYMFASVKPTNVCVCVVQYRDARGMTPFMLAVSGRAYPAAITVLEAAQKIAKGEVFTFYTKCFYSFLYFNRTFSPDAAIRTSHHQLHKIEFAFRPPDHCFQFKYVVVSSWPVLWSAGESNIGDKDDVNSVFMEMICPAGTNPDDSPLYVLCCNDTCSFTWTGAEHINQVNATWQTFTFCRREAKCNFYK